MKNHLNLIVTLATIGCSAIAGDASALSTGVTIESVGNYGGGGNDLPNSVANGYGFDTTLINGGGGWYTQTYYTDGSVYDTDFIDPQIFSVGNDTNNFDKAGSAIAYFTGHGSIAPSASDPCSHDYNCVTPPSNGKLPGTCRSIPGTYNTCAYNNDRHLITHSSHDVFGGYVLRNRNGGVGWGESTNSGSWDSAGTNGGVNLVVNDLSFGVTPTMYWSQLGTGFAGMHFEATIMPTFGDTSMVADRGSKFAAYAVNSGGSVASAWVNTLNSIGREGMSCNGFDSYGGYGGVNGCGCNIIMSVDSTSSRTQAKIVFENWSVLQNDVNDAIGNGYMQWEWVCNYNSNAYPFSNP